MRRVAGQRGAAEMPRWRCVFRGGLLRFKGDFCSPSINGLLLCFLGAIMLRWAFFWVQKEIAFKSAVFVFI